MPQQRGGLSAATVAASINASMVALLRSSSFPLRGVVCAVAVGFSASDEEFVTFPSHECQNSACIAFFLQNGPDNAETVCLDWINGNGNSGSWEEVKLAAQRSLPTVFETVQRSIAMA